MSSIAAVPGIATGQTRAESAPPAAFAFQCKASGGEYFRIWIVNLALTLLSFGIYSAWAKVRRLRYFYGSTVLAGSAFEYHGQPLQILKGRLIAGGALGLYSLFTQLAPTSAVVLVPLLMIALPWVIVKARVFQMRMTSWRGVRFGFHGSYSGAAAAYVGWPLAALATLYALLPLWLQRRTSYILNHTSFGTERFRFSTGAGRYFAFVFTTAALALGMVVVLGLLLAGSLDAARQSGVSAAELVRVVLYPALLLGGVVGVPLGLAIRAYYRAAALNAACEGLALAEHRLRCRLQAERLFWIDFTNFLATLLSFGLFYPFGQVRLYRYQVESLGVDTRGSLDQLAAQQQEASSALGEEFGEAFDIDFGL